jgi:hypothetical protein
MSRTWVMKLLAGYPWRLGVRTLLWRSVRLVKRVSTV